MRYVVVGMKGRPKLKLHVYDRKTDVVMCKRDISLNEMTIYYTCRGTTLNWLKTLSHAVCKSCIKQLCAK